MPSAFTAQILFGPSASTQQWLRCWRSFTCASCLWRGPSAWAVGSLLQLASPLCGRRVDWPSRGAVHCLGYTEIAVLMTVLGSPTANVSFNVLKLALYTSPVLHKFCPHCLAVLTTDPSGKPVATILQQPDNKRQQHQEEHLQVLWQDLPTSWSCCWLCMCCWSSSTNCLARSRGASVTVALKLVGDNKVITWLKMNFSSCSTLCMFVGSTRLRTSASTWHTCQELEILRLTDVELLDWWSLEGYQDPETQTELISLLGNDVLCLINGSEFWQDQQQFGMHTILPKLCAYNNRGF